MRPPPGVPRSIGALDAVGASGFDGVHDETLSMVESCTRPGSSDFANSAWTSCAVRPFSPSNHMTTIPS